MHDKIMDSRLRSNACCAYQKRLATSR